MQNSSSYEATMKTISTEIIQLSQPGFDIAKMNELIDTLFASAKGCAQELISDVDKSALQMAADKLVVHQILGQLYYLDTSKIQVACLHLIALQNTMLRDAFEFIHSQNNYIPLENRSEEDEKNQRFLNVILA